MDGFENACKVIDTGPAPVFFFGVARAWRTNPLCVNLPALLLSDYPVRIPALFLCCLLLAPALSAEEPAVEVVASLPRRDPAQMVALRVQLTKPIPASGSRDEILMAWRARYDAARMLSEPVTILQVARDAEAALAHEPRVQANYQRIAWGQLIVLGRLDEVIALAPAIMINPNIPAHDHALDAARLARLAMDKDDYATARQWLDRAAELLSQSHAHFWPHYSGSQLAEAEVRYWLENGKPDRAQNAVDQMYIMQARMEADPDPNPIETTRIVGLMNEQRVATLARQASVQLLRGAYDKARLTLLEQRALMEKTGVRGRYWTALATEQANVSMAMGRFDQMLAYQQEVERDLQAQKLPTTAIAHFYSAKNLLYALVGLERYAEACTLGVTRTLPLIQLDAATRESRLRNFGTAQGVGCLMAGQPDKAEVLLKDEYARMLRYFPASNGNMRRVKALHLLSQLRLQPDNHDLLNDLSRQVSDLLTQKLSLATGSFWGLARHYDALIYRLFLAEFAALPMGARSPRLVDLAFRAGERQQSAQVLLSVQQAAARQALQKKGLGDLLRQVQDNEFAIKAHRDRLSQQLLKANESTPRIQTLRESLVVLEQEQSILQVQIAREYPDYAALQNLPVPGLPEVATRLRSSEVLVSIVTMPEQTYVWTVLADGKWYFHVSTLSSETITAKVAAIRATLDLGGIARQPSPFAAREAQELYAALLAPTEEFRRGQKHLVVSAGGSLLPLPFAVLQTDARPDSWLIRQTAVSHVPSASVFLALRSGGPHQSAKQAFAGFGDPVFSKQGKPAEGLAFRSLKLPRQMLDSREYKSALKGLADLPALPETREEILAIADALGADTQRDVFVGDAASRSNVLSAPLSDRRVLAFSTHGLLPGDLPGLDQPALALAFEDGSTALPLLTMEDVLGLKLNADWVVLSACNTAAENGRSGEAISGLGQAFFYAGARSLLLTHWAVESNSARDLISHTFRVFAAHPQGMRAEALRVAQLQMADSVRYAHPFFWAAYALEGDGGF